MIFVGTWSHFTEAGNFPAEPVNIRKGEIHKLKEVMKKSTLQGMITFDQALYDLYQAGDISYDDAILYADSPNEVRLMIKLKNGEADKLSQLGSVSLVDPDEM